MRGLRAVLSITVLGLSLAACEQLGIPNPEKEHAKREAEGKAVGAACRHAGRAIEDCYTLNPKALKSAVFAGWKEMNDYMTEHKLEVSIPKLTEKAAEEVQEKKRGKDRADDGFPPPEPFIAPKAQESADKPEEKPAEKAADKKSDKKTDKKADKKPEKEKS